MLKAGIMPQLDILHGAQIWLLLGRRMERSGYVLTSGI
jgi:hypothetical protein